MSHVVIAGGGTGGHLFPGLAVAAELRRAGASVSWLGAHRGLERDRVPQAGIPLRTLAVTGAIGRGPAAAALAALRVPPATLQAAHHLLSTDAAAVLSVGGYAALPGALAAAALGVPFVIQEQNALPGVTNRLLAPWSAAIACGFAGAVAAFPSLPARWTGNPVREEFFHLPDPPLESVSVLVLGGSQGSAFLNHVLPEAFASLAQAGRRPRVVHQAGARWVDEVRQRYAVLHVDATVHPFLERPTEELAGAVLVIARAGALTVCEIAAARRAALLIPFAAAAHGHQLTNAGALAATGAAAVLEENEATPACVAAALAELLAVPARLIERGRASAALARPDAARLVADLVLSRAHLTSPAHDSAAAGHGDIGGDDLEPRLQTGSGQQIGSLPTVDCQLSTGWAEGTP